MSRIGVYECMSSIGIYECISFIISTYNNEPTTCIWSSV